MTIDELTQWIESPINLSNDWPWLLAALLVLVYLSRGKKRRR